MVVCWVRLIVFTYVCGRYACIYDDLGCDSVLGWDRWPCFCSVMIASCCGVHVYCLFYG